MAILVIVGLARTGKDTVADYIEKKYGYRKYTFSKVLEEALKIKGINPDKEKMLELGDALREEMGMDVVAKMLSEKVREKNNITLVGPRSMEEIEYFRKQFPKLRIIKVTAEKEKRFERKSEQDEKDEKKFFERDSNDMLTKGFGKVIDAAEKEIKNSSSEEDLYKQIDQLMRDIEKD